MLLDTDVMVHVLRGHAPAVAWLGSLGSTPVALPGLVAMELLQGRRNTAEQRRLEITLASFPLQWPASADCGRAYLDFSNCRLSHNLGLIDSLIGQTAVGLGLVLATFNVKHYAVVTGLVTLQPY